MEESREKKKREIRRNETIIIPGIDRGVIPMNIFPEDLSGVMTKYYEKLLPKEGKKFGKLSGFAAFLIIFFGATTLIGLLYAMLQYSFNAGNDWFYEGSACCYGWGGGVWWEKVNRLWDVICSLKN